MSTLLRVVFLFAIWLLVAADAAGLCLPKYYYRHVGNTASDSSCTDNDIQTAINNSTCPNTVITITHEHTYTSQALDINGKVNLILVGAADGAARPAKAPEHDETAPAWGGRRRDEGCAAADHRGRRPGEGNPQDHGRENNRRQGDLSFIT